MNELINDEGVSRTAPATPGLLKILKAPFFFVAKYVNLRVDPQLQLRLGSKNRTIA